MRLRLAVVPLLLVLAGCATAPQHAAPVAQAAAPAPVAPAAPPAPAGPPADDNLNATLWAQRALEHDLVYRQTYAQAQEQLLKALKDKSWDALPKGERKAKAAGLPPAVIVDVDETVLDNSAYQARLIRDGKEFDEFEWDKWCREEKAKALPGALEFARFAAAHGVTMFYLTNRAQHLNGATLDNLKKTGFPVSAKETVFYGLGTVVKDCEANGSNKGCRRELIGRSHRVLMMVGDQLSDFLDLDINTLDGRAAAAQPYLPWFGQRWFALPNATYGSWESAIIGNHRDEDLAARRAVKREALDTQTDAAQAQ
jgi:acid phosphatase